MALCSSPFRCVKLASNASRWASASSTARWNTISRSLLAAARPLAARGGPHLLDAATLQAELALFVASGAAAKILAQALDG